MRNSTCDCSSVHICARSCNMQQVEDLSKEVEVKPRKSKPDLNSVHLCFPQHLRQVPVAAARPKNGGRGGGGDKADCQPRWQGVDKAPEPLVIRVTIDGGREREEELCEQINKAARDYAHRRADLSVRLARLLDLRRTPFCASDASHRSQLEDLWRLAMGPDTPLPPTSGPPPASPSTMASGSGSAGAYCADQQGAADWGDLGFQNRYCPQSDFRDMGMLSGSRLP